MLDICQISILLHIIYRREKLLARNPNVIIIYLNPILLTTEHTHMLLVGGRQAFTYTVSVILKSQHFLLCPVTQTI